LDLPPEQVHVWKANLDEFRDSYDCLSKDEELRAARLKSPEKSARFRAARAVLRVLLAAYTHQSPQDIRFIYGARGKPCLQSEPGAPVLEFNLSHCGNLLLAAFSAQAPVGIDLELIQPMEQRSSIIRQYFTANVGMLTAPCPRSSKTAPFCAPGPTGKPLAKPMEPVSHSDRRWISSRCKSAIRQPLNTTGLLVWTIFGCCLFLRRAVRLPRWP
jgi:4'-phosphopantetheinyl transferase EntD